MDLLGPPRRLRTTANREPFDLPSGLRAVTRNLTRPRSLPAAMAVVLLSAAWGSPATELDQSDRLRGVSRVHDF